MGLRRDAQGDSGVRFRSLLRGRKDTAGQTTLQLSGVTHWLRARVLEQGRYLRFAGLLPRLEAERLVAHCSGQAVSPSVGGRKLRTVLKLDQCHDLKAAALTGDDQRALRENLPSSVMKIPWGRI
jgi:hypothetical protein